jgi:hypothetical protein
MCVSGLGSVHKRAAPGLKHLSGCIFMHYHYMLWSFTRRAGPQRPSSRLSEGLYMQDCRYELLRTPQPGVKIGLATAHFHGFGVARAGSWNTVEKSPSARSEDRK